MCKHSSTHHRQQSLNPFAKSARIPQRPMVFGSARRKRGLSCARVLVQVVQPAVQTQQVVQNTVQPVVQPINQPVCQYNTEQVGTAPSFPCKQGMLCSNNLTRSRRFTSKGHIRVRVGSRPRW